MDPGWIGRLTIAFKAKDRISLIALGARFLNATPCTCFSQED